MVWQLTVRRSRESGNPRVVGVNVGYPSRPPNSERYRLFPLAKVTEPLYYSKHMACGSPYHWGQNHKATEATTCEMPENQEKTPCSKLTKRNPDSKLNSDTTPASDAQTQRPEMTGNDREIKISELTFRQQAALPRIALAQAQAARDAGVAESTLRRWLQDPSFRQEFDRLRQELDRLRQELDRLRQELDRLRQELDRLRQESYDLARQAMRGLGQLWHRANPYGSLRSVIPAFAGIQG